MTPYSFGYNVGAHLEKRADVPMQMGGEAPPSFLDGVGQLAFGTAPALGTGQLDPWQRGMVQDIALYSNPFTGVATGINDVTRHLMNGRYMNALGSVGMTGLSFLPGAGAVFGKAIGRTVGNVGTRMAGRAAAGSLRQATGNAIANTGKNMTQFATRGGQISQNINQGISTQLQKKLPLFADPAKRTYGNYFTTRAWNEGIRNPYSAMGAMDQAGGLFLAPPTPAGAGNAMPPPPMRAPNQMPPFPQMNQPMPFRPMPMVR